MYCSLPDHCAIHRLVRCGAGRTVRHGSDVPAEGGSFRLHAQVPGADLHQGDTLPQEEFDNTHADIGAVGKERFIVDDAAHPLQPFIGLLRVQSTMGVVFGVHHVGAKAAKPVLGKPVGVQTIVGSAPDLRLGIGIGKLAQKVGVILPIPGSPLLRRVVDALGVEHVLIEINPLGAGEAGHQVDITVQCPGIELLVVVVVQVNFFCIAVYVGLQADRLALLHEERRTGAAPLGQIGGVAGDHRAESTLAPVGATRIGQEFNLDGGIGFLELGIKFPPKFSNACGTLRFP